VKVRKIDEIDGSLTCGVSIRCESKY